MNNLVNYFCPVCGKEMRETICKYCGYTRFLFPRELPPQVIGFEDTRIRIMRRCYKRVNNFDTQSMPMTIGQGPVIVGTLIIRNLMTDTIYPFPIYEGNNIYGALESDNYIRHFIDPIKLGIDIPDLIFGISTIEKCFRLIPSKDFHLSHNRCLITKNMDLDNEDYFFYSNLLSFNAVKF